MSITLARKCLPSDARRGTTLIEVVVALSIASVLMSITFTALSKVSTARNASSARDAYVWMSRRARASAIQLGTKVNVVLVPGTATASVVRASNSAVLDGIDIGQEFGVTISGLTSTLTITYDPRGIGSPSATPTITFTQGSSTAQARVQGLGQVEVLQ